MSTVLLDHRPLRSSEAIVLFASHCLRISLVSPRHSLHHALVSPAPSSSLQSLFLLLPLTRLPYTIAVPLQPSVCQRTFPLPTPTLPDLLAGTSQTLCVTLLQILPALFSSSTDDTLLDDNVSDNDNSFPFILLCFLLAVAPKVITPGAICKKSGRTNVLILSTPFS